MSRTLSSHANRFAVVTALLAVAAARPAVAQTFLPAPSGASSPPIARVAIAAPDQSSGQKKGPFRFEDHPELRMGKVRVMFRARFQADLRESDAPTGDIDEQTIDIARRRVGVEGRVADAVEFQFEYELVRFDPLRDAYVNMRQWDVVQLQAGKFKQPFGLEENTSATNLDFAYRSLAASILSPGRDVGFMVHGRPFRGRLRYEWGVFEHDGRNARPRNAARVVGGQTRTWRIGSEPFATSSSPIADLLVGFAWSETEVTEGFSGIRGKTVLGADFFDSNFLVNGPRERRGFELRWRPGPASLKAEWIRLTEERQGVSTSDSDLSRLRSTGWYVSGTWALTGERKSQGLENPKKPILKGGVGAIEVAARVETLKFESESTANDLPSFSLRADVIAGNRARVTTIGVNWYANRWIKVQLNFIREELDDPSQGPLPAQPKFSSRVLRLQFTL